MIPALIIGAGLAGLAAALDLQAAGVSTLIVEAAPFAGGRCRSFYDPRLGVELNNGSHMLLSGNHAALGYLRRLGMDGALTRLSPAALPFVNGWLPLSLAGWRRYGAKAAGRAALDNIKRSALNNPTDAACARLWWPCLRETVLRGDTYSQPMLPTLPLSALFIDPATARLNIRYNSRVVGLSPDSITLADGSRLVANQIILAIPPHRAAELLPGLTVPIGAEPIINAHFLCPSPPKLRDGLPLLGLIDGPVDWVFAHGPVLSATRSAASQYLHWPSERLARAIWQQVASLAGHDSNALPAWRIIREKRATFAQTSANQSRRPSTQGPWPGLFLAGDWTRTGLPATIEGAIRSGQRAAAALLANR